MKEVKSMSQIDYEQDRVQSVTQADAAKSLSDKVIQLKDLEDEISNAEKSVSKLKEQAKQLSQFDIPAMMEEMHITKLKLKDGESVEIKKIYCASIPQEHQEAAFTWLRNNDLGDILKMILPLPLVEAKTTRLQNMLALHKVRGMSPSRKLAFIPRHLKQ